jgi:hypothetical protein
MALIRRDLHDDVRGVVASAEAVTDWKRYVASSPWLSLAAAFAVGYLVVPRRHRTVAAASPTGADVSKVVEAIEAARDRAHAGPARGGLFGVAVGFLTPVVVRAAQAYAASYLEQWIASQQGHWGGGAPHPAPAPAPSAGGAGKAGTGPLGGGY